MTISAILDALIAAHEAESVAANNAASCRTAADFRRAASAAEAYTDAREVAERRLAALIAQPRASSTPTIASVTLSGRTRWESTEWSRARGASVKIRDAKGKPIERAARSIVVRIACTDGIVYVFGRPISNRTDERWSERCGHVTAKLSVHGMTHDVSSYNVDDLPKIVRQAYEQAERSAAVMLRAYGTAAWLALPTERRPATPAKPASVR